MKGGVFVSWKRLLIGISIGFAAGLFLSKELQKDEVSPEKVLKLVKQSLNEKFHITGSWIHMVPENYEKNEMNYTVYRGGITTTNDEDEVVQYDFIVDAKTGTILELSK